MTTVARIGNTCGMATPDLIGTTEAAERCGVDRTTFFRWVQLGHIRPVQKLPGRTGALLFNPADVDALIAKRTAEHTEAVS